MRLGHPGRDRADADLGDELDVDPSAGVRVLQVVDELRQVLDRVDVVVRRRRDQTDPGRRVPGPRHPRVDLVRGQLAALARLGALRHLDLQVVGVDEVLARHPEPTARDLLDRRALRVAVGQRLVAVGVLPALTGVGLAAEPVHRDRQRLVRLLADRAVRHRAGREPTHDGLDRLDLVDRDRRTAFAVEAEEPPQGHEALGLLVDARRVGLEDVVALGPRGVLEPEDRLRVEQVRLTLATPLVLPTDGEPTVGRRDAAGRVGRGVPERHLLGDHLEPDAAEGRAGAGEPPVDDVLREADGLEDLRAAVGRDRRDAHLRHHLEDALAQRLDEVADRLLGRDVAEGSAAGQVLGALHREVGVHGRGAVADEQRDVVHLAHVAGLDEQGHVAALLGPREVVVDRGGEQQRRDRRVVGAGVAVAQDEEPAPRRRWRSRPPRRSPCSRASSAAPPPATG